MNEEGWILTAFHILKLIDNLATETTTLKGVITQRAAINNDPNLSRNSKNKALGQLLKLKPDATEEHSVWWGADGLSIAGAWSGIEAADIAIAKLEPFNSGWVSIFQSSKTRHKESNRASVLLDSATRFSLLIPHGMP